MKISSKQLVMMREAVFRDFLTRMIADLKREGYSLDEEIARTRSEESISFGLIDEGSVRTYVECYLRLERANFNLARLQRIVGAVDLDRDHKLIALRILVDRVENSTKGSYHV